MANYNYINSSGTIVPDTSQVLTDVQNYFKEVFGADLNINPSTPQGILITAQTIILTTVILNNAQLANQINPNIAGGLFLDAILALLGQTRVPNTHSVVSITMAGVAGTIVPESVQVANAEGDLFRPLATYTLDSGGTFTGDYQAIEPGPIAAPMGTITTIVQGILGLETVTNPSDAILGTDTQSDEAARLKRLDTLFLQGSGSLGAIMSNVNATPNVRSSTGRENVENTNQTIDGVLLVPHSIYLCIDGGTDADVAFAIISKKNPGCNYNNGASSHPITQPYVDPISGQTYDVKFDRPDIIDVLVRATVQLNQSIVNPEVAVTKAINDYANGLIDGEPGLRVGISVSCFELSGAVNIEVPQLYVVNMEVSLASPISYSNNPIPISIFEKANITLVTVVVV